MEPIDRRDAIKLSAVMGAWLALPTLPSSLSSSWSASRMIACFIHYQIDPAQREVFEQYATAWASIIPRCGGHLIGYFLPYEGTNDIGWGLIAFDSLASYETYRARIKADPGARANFAMVQGKRAILREERTFVEVVNGTFELPAKR